MSRVKTSSNSIFAAIVNEDAFPRSQLMDVLDRMLYVKAIGGIIFQYVNVWRMTLINWYR